MFVDHNRFDAQAVKRALEYKDTFGFVLLSIVLSCLDVDNEDLTRVDMDIVAAELEERFDAKIPDENINKLNAAVTLLTSDYIYTDINVLKAVSLALDDGDIGELAVGGDEDVDVCQILWAVMEDSLINDESFDDNIEKFNDNVSDWINTVIAEEGYDADSDESLDEVSEMPYYGRLIRGKLLLLTAQIEALAGDNDILKDELHSAVQLVLADNGLGEQANIAIQEV